MHTLCIYIQYMFILGVLTKVELGLVSPAILIIPSMLLLNEVLSGNPVKVNVLLGNPVKLNVLLLLGNPVKLNDLL